MQDTKLEALSLSLDTLAYSTLSVSLTPTDTDQNEGNLWIQRRPWAVRDKFRAPGRPQDLWNIHQTGDVANPIVALTQVEDRIVRIQANGQHLRGTSTWDFLLTVHSWI